MYWFIFSKTDLLLIKHADGTYSVPEGAESPVPLHPWDTVHKITPLADGTEVRTVLCSMPSTPSANYEFVPLRRSYHLLPEAFYLKAGKCQEILYWDQNTKFCGVCGGEMRLHTDISKRCRECGKEVWPQLATAVIVLVSRGDEILMALNRNSRTGHYALVAGFVETGETLEEACVREVKEETGIDIENVRYVLSQPWPYPCGLMVGFFADYKSGSIHLQQEELKDAKWFRIDQLPELPDGVGTARRLVEKYISEQKNQEK